MTNQNSTGTPPTDLVPAEQQRKEVDLTSGIAPKDFADLVRFSDLVNKSKLAPLSFNTPEKIAVGILTNMELGRPIITGLQDLAIINGKCGIYGDASLAMVTASGLMEEGYPIEEESGTPFQDDWTFIFKVKRKGGPERVGKWTWIEAKRAGFDQPKTRDGRPDRWSPWSRFTRRMMQWKARNYVLRDTFGDILKGMKTVEDLHDMDAVPLTKGIDGTYGPQPDQDNKDLETALKENVSKEEEPAKKLDQFQQAVKEEEGAVVDAETPEKEEAQPDPDPTPVKDLGSTHPWFRKKWANKRKGDNISTGYGAYVKEHLITFSEAPEDIQTEARQKYQALYEEPWPGDSVSDDQAPGDDPGPEKEKPPTAGVITDGNGPETIDGPDDIKIEKRYLCPECNQDFGSIEELKDHVCPAPDGKDTTEKTEKQTTEEQTTEEAPAKEPPKKIASDRAELEAEAEAAAKKNVDNLNAIRKFDAKIRNQAYDKIGLKAPVLLSTEKFETVQTVRDLCEAIAAGKSIDQEPGGQEGKERVDYTGDIPF